MFMGGFYLLAPGCLTAWCLLFVLAPHYVSTAGDFCASTPCHRNQICINSESSHHCYCPPGYAGSFCQVDCPMIAADIIFVLDISSSQGVSDWHLSLAVVMSLITSLDMRQRLTVAPSSIHFGVVTYADTAIVRIALSSYKTTNLISSLEELPLPRNGSSGTSDAFRLLRSAVFGAGHQGNRPEAPNIAIFITDGATMSDSLPSEVTSPMDAAMLVYAAGINKRTNMQHLMQLTGGSTERVLRVDDFRSRDRFLDELLKNICHRKGPRGPPGHMGPPGPAGNPGYPGSTGPSGRQGANGSEGAVGLQGEPGHLGPEGKTGLSGPPGPQGVIGRPGEQGLQGRPGDLGDPGLPGRSPPGPPGIHGATGALGWQGEPGMLGPPGRQGLAGGSGMDGPTGREGAPGEQGLVGVQGSPGDKGKVGIRGPPGNLGQEGATGTIQGWPLSCQSLNNTCEHICVSTGNNITCQCFHGYELRDDGFSCEEVESCSRDNGGCEDFCHGRPGGHVCSCPRGFSLSADLRSCIDVDECCGKPVCENTTHQKCVNTYGSYVCLDIAPGYQIDPVTGNVRAVKSGGWDPVRREVVVGLLAWTSALTVLLLLTCAFTWLADDLLLRMFAETERRRKHLENRTPREFFMFPKIEASLARNSSADQLAAARGVFQQRYIDEHGMLTPHDPRNEDPRGEGYLQGEDRGETPTTSTFTQLPRRSLEVEGGPPSATVSLDTLEGPCRGELALCPSMEMLPTS